MAAVDLVCNPQQVSAGGSNEESEVNFAEAFPTGNTRVVTIRTDENNVGTIQFNTMGVTVASSFAYAKDKTFVISVGRGKLNFKKTQAADKFTIEY